MATTSGYGINSAPPFQLLFFLFIVLMLLFMSWYLTFESTLEESMDQLKIVFMIVPLILLLAVRWLSVGRPVAGILPRVEPDAIHRAGSSPWGVAMVVLLLLFFMAEDNLMRIWQIVAEKY
ncbi:uncharacterized protein LOC131054356 [Cryptomeria japonica]|uniref:uncharacterized protein LOC131054356 n=1 Tax=Cryptomeria japonica TaxID=3369 RepID=UPI0027DA063F|nr:uncharacterized protein LOC131054356 [Cryptomeria japonica]